MAYFKSFETEVSNNHGYLLLIKKNHMFKKKKFRYHGLGMQQA